MVDSNRGAVWSKAAIDAAGVGEGVIPGACSLRNSKYSDPATVW
jgi:hypothetical protein